MELNTTVTNVSYEIKILGYIYGNVYENWFKVKTKIQKSISKWNNLKLSLEGKKTVINQVLLSKIWYLACVETPPQTVTQEIRDISFCGVTKRYA